LPAAFAHRTELGPRAIVMACGDGNWSVWRIHGQPAQLLEFCAPAGCARLSGDYALAWRERGLGINLITHRLSEHQLLDIARSMTVVPA
jgi:hypothetical protein